MGFFDDLKAAAIEKVKDKVKEELAELGIDLDEIDDADEDAPEENTPSPTTAEGDEDEDGKEEEKPAASAWSTPLDMTSSTNFVPAAAAATKPPCSSSVSSFPSPDSSTTFQEAFQTLWDLDDRLTTNKDYKIDVQSSKKPYRKGVDAANDPLFTYVKPQVLRNRPTFTTFISLLNNYSAHTGEKEDVTEEELQENRAFLNEVMKTAPMKYCHRYCVAKGISYRGNEISDSESQFKQVLNSLWFDMYSRSGGVRDSSGFEHVFVGEVKEEKVSGFHNWIQFYLEEKRNHIDYLGYIKPRCRDDSSTTLETNDDDPILTLQFEWNGYEKFVGTSFIGVTPEFELSLYTMAFLSAEDGELVTLDAGGEKFDLKVRCHKYNGGVNVGSCYVEALAHHE